MYVDSEYFCEHCEYCDIKKYNIPILICDNFESKKFKNDKDNFNFDDLKATIIQDLYEILKIVKEFNEAFALLCQRSNLQNK